MRIIMGDIFTDENNQYQIDCTDAIWISIG